MTVFGLVTALRLSYGARRHTGLSPLDAALNLPEELHSHGLRRLAAIEAARGFAYYFHTDHLGMPRALTNASGQAAWTATVLPDGEVLEDTTPDPLSGRTVVTNLRYPGQYDERLLGSVGLQGPYYNWNRWYLPGVGRYLELDPIALAGGFNGEFGPDWYGYANQNPLRWTDRRGLSYFDDRLCPGCEDTCCCAEVKWGPGSCPGGGQTRSALAGGERRRRRGVAVGAVGRRASAPRTAARFVLSARNGEGGGRRAVGQVTSGVAS